MHEKDDFIAIGFLICITNADHVGPRYSKGILCDKREPSFKIKKKALNFKFSAFKVKYMIEGLE
jgi:hypothetical protein